MTAETADLGYVDRDLKFTRWGRFIYPGLLGYDTKLHGVMTQNMKI
jgi:hypothetical protein